MSTPPPLTTEQQRLLALDWIVAGLGRAFLKANPEARELLAAQMTVWTSVFTDAQLTEAAATVEQLRRMIGVDA